MTKASATSQDGQTRARGDAANGTSTVELTTGQVIRQRRTECGFSQTRLAAMLDTRRQRIILWEKDKHVPSAGYAVMLAEALGGEASDYAGEATLIGVNPRDFDALAIAVAELAERVRRLEEG